MAAALRVAVVGAGLAGLTCALAAARGGAQVDVYEAAASLPAAAAHVDVVPNMVRELARWGVLDDCVRLGFPYRRQLVLAQDGRQLLAIEAMRLAQERHPAALGITQQALHTVLAQAAVEAGVRFHWAAPVRMVEEVGGQAVLHLDDAPPAKAQLLLLACGARASLREAVYGPQTRLEQVGPPWRYLLAARPARLDEALLATGRQGRKAHVVPVSATQAGVRWCEPRLVDAEPTDAGAVLRTFGDPVRALVPLPAGVEGPATRPVLVGLLPRPWNRGPILAVGDCAHALAPHFGQAAAMAAEDAGVLGELFAAGLAPAPLVDAFVARRSPRAAQVLALTLQAARWDLAPEPGMDLLALARQLSDAVAQPA
jgi:2-polyprenyl-6-methoxyphenol hydroxylase-like FAD-dependent oxidoreductase